MAKQLKYSESILAVKGQKQDDTHCCLCGSTQYVQRHEIFYGRAYRQKSKKYGLWVNVCQACHDKIHFGKDHSIDRKLKQGAQECFEELYGHTLFMTEFDKNYL